MLVFLCTWSLIEVDGRDGAGNGIVPADYEMDPRVVDQTLEGFGIRDALLDIPSVLNEFLHFRAALYHCDIFEQLENFVILCTILGFFCETSQCINICCSWR